MSKKYLKNQIIDCACVIHGDYYDFKYVEILERSLKRHLSCEFRFHVWTESHRTIPNHMIKHNLADLGVAGPKSAWWHKTQLFNTNDFSGKLYYFDLDTIIVGNLDWLQMLPDNIFWAVRDFRYLWRPHKTLINSSVMIFNNSNLSHIWEKFLNNKHKIIKKYHGDQDYIHAELSQINVNNQFLDIKKVKSYRWEVLHGGIDFVTRQYPKKTSVSVEWAADTSIIIFHGEPKPHQIYETKLINHWF